MLLQTGSSAKGSYSFGQCSDKQVWKADKKEVLFLSFNKKKLHSKINGVIWSRILNCWRLTTDGRIEFISCRYHRTTSKECGRSIDTLLGRKWRGNEPVDEGSHKLIPWKEGGMLVLFRVTWFRFSHTPSKLRTRQAKCFERAEKGTQ
jgi:hypothetical protein